jgi:hypothetical protein
VNGLGQSHGDRDPSGHSSSIRKKYSDLHEEKYATGGSLHSRPEGSSQSTRQDDPKEVDSLLISRLNCDSKGTSSASAYTSRNSSSSSSQSSHPPRGEEKSGPTLGHGQGSKHGNISEEKSNSSSSGSGASSSANSNSLKGPGKKKEKDEDDLMDFLLDDSNF